MEYYCHTYFKYLVFQMKNIALDSDQKKICIQNFKILGFSDIEFEVLGISSEVPSILKT